MPPLEAWEKVYIKLGSADSVEDLEIHFTFQSCEECHNGDPTVQDNVEDAHVDLIADPSSMEVDACGQCHTKISESFQTSMHQNLWGEQSMIAGRVGVLTFAEVPKTLQDGFKGECANCHASCGDCHISIPNSAGKGFVKSHKFQKTPHQKNQCMACHGSRVAHDYMGDEDQGTKPDIHFAKGKNCMFCHTGVEMHAAAEGTVDRYHYKESPTCEGCHDVAGENAYHSMHWDSLSCQVCHSQPYNNCAGCHVTGAYKKDPEYQENNPATDFRIGANPFPDRRFDFVLVRHIPIAKDTYDLWGEPGLLKNYDSIPTWKYTTPHSIRRWTARTEVADGASCGANCHLDPTMGSPDNADLYLFESYVEANWPDEAAANSSVVVDGKLPDGWEQ